MSLKKVSFNNQNRAEFMQELRSQVKDYFDKNNISKYGNANLVIKTIFMLILYFAPYVMMLTGVIQSIPGMFICWIIMGVAMAGVGMVVMHDANHGSFSKNSKTNNFLAKTLYLLGGFPTTWREQHNSLHHGFTNINGYDEDISPISILRFNPHRPLKKIHRFQYIYAWFFYGIMTLSWATTKDFRQLANYKKRNVALSSRLNYNFLLYDLIVSKALYFIVFLVIPLLLIPVSWSWIVLFFVVMHFVCGIILGAVFQVAHVMPTTAFPVPDEEGNIEHNWAIHQLKTTSDYSPKSRVFSWLIGGLNFQVEHHLFPNISHVHYRKISQYVKRTAHKYKLPYHVQPNFVKAVYNHIKMLKSLGNQPG